MSTSRMRMAVLMAAAMLSSVPERSALAQDRVPLTRDDAVLLVDGVVREVFQSRRQDRVDFLVQIEVKRSEAVRATSTPARVPVPAPGNLVYVHAYQRAGSPLGLGQVGSDAPQADVRPLVPAERSQIRAYLVPDAKGGWGGAGSDWFALTSNDLAAAGPTDPPPTATRAPGSPSPKPEAAPTRVGKLALVTLGLTGEARIVQDRFVVRVSSVDPGGPAQRAGIERGDVLFGVNNKILEGPDQLDQLSKQGGVLNLMVLDVNTGKTARVQVHLTDSDQPTTTNGLPPLSSRPGGQAAPGANRNPGSTAAVRSLGMSAEPVMIGQRTGMKVTGVEPQSPVQKAGIEPGDVIVAANGVPITGADTLSAVLHKSGASLTLTVRDTRTGRDLPVEVKLGAPDAGSVTPIPADPTLPTGTGRRLGAVTEIVFHDVDPAAKVTEVERGGPADTAGIEPGDIIVEANGTPVLHPKTLDEIVRNSGPVLKLMVVDPRTRKKTPVEVQLGGGR
jgi:serine protease Do